MNGKLKSRWPTGRTKCLYFVMNSAHANNTETSRKTRLDWATCGGLMFCLAAVVALVHLWKYSTLRPSHKPLPSHKLLWSGTARIIKKVVSRLLSDLWQRETMAKRNSRTGWDWPQWTTDTDETERVHTQKYSPRTEIKQKMWGPSSLINSIYYVE